MKRIISSVAILIILLIITIVGNILILLLTQNAYDSLRRIEGYAAIENSAAAESEINSLINLLNTKRYIFEMFIKRDYISNLCVSVEGLRAYVDSETWRDLQSEAAKAMELLYSIKQLFFSVI